MTYIGLDTTQHERSRGGGGNEPLPEGFYSGIITRSQMRDCGTGAKDPNGKYLEVELDITSPSEFGNRKFWDKFNLINSNSKTVEISRGQLSDLAQSVNIVNLGESEELIGKECSFYVTVKPAANGFGASNTCKKYLPIGSTEADYHAWVAEKKGAAAPAAAAPERKTWGAAAPAAAPADAPEAAAVSAVASWKK